MFFTSPPVKVLVSWVVEVLQTRDRGRGSLRVSKRKPNNTPSDWMFVIQEDFNESFLHKRGGDSKLDLPFGKGLGEVVLRGIEPV